MATETQKGCGAECRVSQVTDETFICGLSTLNGKIWYCNDCMLKGKIQILDSKRRHELSKKIVKKLNEKGANLGNCSWDIVGDALKHEGF